MIPSNARVKPSWDLPIADVFTKEMEQPQTIRSLR